uniref:Rho termination factor-like N-terminal domain-containing protein n=2 Tax=Rhizophora mucronata TaxID=61149 RepID=A0A2P2JR46_RHIMU
MSQAVHLVAKSVPGYVPSEGRLRPHSRTSGRAFVSSSSSSSSPCGEHRTSLQVRMGLMKCAFRAGYISCKASSGGHRRNPDFSRQNKQGFFRNINRRNEERESFELFDESDMLSSKNGPLPSLSGTQKSQATAAPGPREKEIVELFKKVQAQLRERAAAKEDNRVEASQAKGRQSETVDSLLKLLRKHSIEKGKKKTSWVNDQDSDLDQPEQNGPHAEAKSKSFAKLNSTGRIDVVEPKTPSLTRPLSNFQRKSPVPQVKLQPICSTDDHPVKPMPQLNLNVDKKQQFVKLSDPADADKAGQEEEPEVKLEPRSPYLDDVLDELSEDESSEEEHTIEEDRREEQISKKKDLGLLKLSELRALAKSCGIKGFSKMKKGELVELLNCRSV